MVHRPNVTARGDEIVEDKTVDRVSPPEGFFCPHRVDGEMAEKTCS